MTDCEYSTDKCPEKMGACPCVLKGHHDDRDSVNGGKHRCVHGLTSGFLYSVGEEVNA